MYTIRAINPVTLQPELLCGGNEWRTVVCVVEAAGGLLIPIQFQSARDAAQYFMGDSGESADIRASSVWIRGPRGGRYAAATGRRL